MENVPHTSTFPEAELDHELMASAPPRRVAALSPLEGEVALCLSGGGYRAAAFHLGVLDMLRRLALLKRVRTLSTVSGGTITGAIYALSCAREESFDAFYDRLYRALESRNVVANAFAALQADGRAGLAPSLIRAAADVYAQEDFVGDAHFSMLMDTSEGPDDLVFSSTEFRTGLAFRFQTSRHGDPYIGNQPPLRIPESVARSIRLADVVAASSCFPGAFEPIRFPDDFQWEAPLDQVRRQLGEGFSDPVPLMDGGVYDNQGVDGVKQVYRRRGREVGFVIISDTSPRKTSLFAFPVSKRRRGLSVRNVVWIGYGVFAGSILAAALLAVQLARSLGPGFGVDDVFLLGLPLLLTLVVAVGLVWLRRTFHREQHRVRTETEVHLWPALADLSISDVLDLVESRARSLVALTSSIFMKRVRGLIQRSLFIDEEYRHRVAFNLIYDMDRSRPTLYRDAPWIEPNAALETLAREAESVPTTLWMSETQLLTLIAAGQATTCFTIMEYLLEHRSVAAGETGTEEAALLGTARDLWMQLMNNPMAFVRQVGS